jgi:hypothetical protein
VPARSFLRVGVGSTLRGSERASNSQRHGSGGIGPVRTLRPALPPPTPAALPIPRLAVQHSPQRQAAQRRAKTPHGPKRREDEDLVTTGTFTRPRRTFFVERGWALALAPRRDVRWRRAMHLRWPFPTALPIASLLRPPSFPALRRRPIALARSPPPPVPRGLLTGCTAITDLGTRRYEQAFAAFQQTPPRPPRPPWLWPSLAEMMK